MKGAKREKEEITMDIQVSAFGALCALIAAIFLILKKFLPRME